MLFQFMQGGRGNGQLRDCLPAISGDMPTLAGLTTAQIQNQPIDAGFRLYFFQPPPGKPTFIEQIGGHYHL